MKAELRIDALLLSFAILLTQSACTERRQSLVCEEFLNSNQVHDDRVFRGLDLDTQLTIQRCGIDWHPRIDFSGQIAELGKVILPTILERLNRKDQLPSYDAERWRLGIIKIIQRLAVRGELSDSEYIVNDLERAVSDVSTSWIRNEANDSLLEIRRSIKADRNTTVGI